MAKNKVISQWRCRDCVNATDFHEKNLKGEYFLCKCKYFKYSKFLNKDWCNNFKKNES